MSRVPNKLTRFENYVILFSGEKIMSFYEFGAERQDYFYFNHVKKEQTTLPHFHSSIELLFCVDGKQELCVGGETQKLEKGEACFIDSYVVHSLLADSAEVYVVLADAHFFLPFFSALGEKAPPTVFRFDNPEFLSLLYALHQRNRASEVGRVETSKAIVRLLLAEICECISFIPRKTNTQNELVANILQYTAEHFSSDLSLGTLALRFGYSRDYLSRLLHRYLGLNWNIYVANLRAREAHALLERQEELSVLDASLSCGFESLNTFYRAYRRVFGKTPLEK